MSLDGITIHRATLDYENIIQLNQAIDSYLGEKSMIWFGMPDIAAIPQPLTCMGEILQAHEIIPTVPKRVLLQSHQSSTGNDALILQDPYHDTCFIPAHSMLIYAMGRESNAIERIVLSPGDIIVIERRFYMSWRLITKCPRKECMQKGILFSTKINSDKHVDNLFVYTSRVYMDAIDKLKIALVNEMKSSTANTLTIHNLGNALNAYWFKIDQLYERVEDMIQTTRDKGVQRSLKEILSDLGEFKDDIDRSIEPIYEMMARY